MDVFADLVARVLTPPLVHLYALLHQTGILEIEN